MRLLHALFSPWGKHRFLLQSCTGLFMVAEKGLQTLMDEYRNSNRAIRVSLVDWNMHWSLGADLLINSLVQHSWSGFSPVSFFPAWAFFCPYIWAVVGSAVVEFCIQTTEWPAEEWRKKLIQPLISTYACAMHVTEESELARISQHKPMICITLFPIYRPWIKHF